ncbi:MAG: hypothetical protein GXZ11_06895 [Tissierellia bacterium]|nr:hypothetical protein [Tissierellia bacterium]
MKNFLNRLFMNRYGMDKLGRFINIIIIVLLSINLFIKSRLLNGIILFFIIFMLIRIFSKDVVSRERENTYYCTQLWKLRRWKNTMLSDIKIRKNYKLFLCPICSKKMKVPKGKGKIKVTCPHCGHSFEKRS